MNPSVATSSLANAQADAAHNESGNDFSTHVSILLPVVRADLPGLHYKRVFSRLSVERSQGAAPGGLRGGSQPATSICTLRAFSGTKITKLPSSIISRGTRSSGGCRAGVA